MLLLPLTLLLPVTYDDPMQSAPPEVRSESQWVVSLSTFWMEPPHESGYLSGIVSADRGSLHLEAHWAYEDRDTLSFFVGKSFPIEGDIAGVVTPRIGIAGGDSDGIVPAVALELGWEMLSFTTDIEYLIATSDETDSFLYSWSELTVALSDKFDVGVVGQRTNVFDNELTVDRGLLAGVALGPTRLALYWFNPDLDDSYVSIALEAAF